MLEFSQFLMSVLASAPKIPSVRLYFFLIFEQKTKLHMNFKWTFMFCSQACFVPCNLFLATFGNGSFLINLNHSVKTRAATT